MLILLPLLVFVLLVALFWNGCGSRRAALVWAALVFAALTLALTEGLSLLGLLRQGPVTAVWLAASAVVGVINWRGRPRNSPPAPLRLDRFEWALLAALGLFAAVLLVVALASAPNTYDSLTYHMSRVMHWAQNGSVDFYPTAVTRQLYQHPLAEYGILHLYLLAGSDQFVNLVAWAAWGLGAAAVSLIARELGGSRRAQVLSAVAWAMLPMALLQATSTANDLISALWVACFAWFCLRGVRHGLTWPVIAGLGMSLGLALATKGSVYLYLLPLAVWLAVAAILRHSVRAIGYGAVILVVALVFPAAHLARNQAESGSVLGSDGPLYANQIMGFDVLLSNFSRNLALELAVPEPLDSTLGVSAALNRGLAALHETIGLDVSDPRTTWETGLIVPPEIHEAHLGATLMTLLGLLALVFYLARRRPLATRPRSLYLLMLALVLLMFSIGIRYMPWHARLHLPIWALAVPWIIPALEESLPRRWMSAAAVLLLVAGLPPLLANVSRPLVGPNSVLTTERWTQLFANRPEARDSFAAAMEATGDCDAIGLLFAPGSPEYPLWVYAEMQGRAVRFEHLTGGETDFTPCAILADIDLGPAPSVPGFTQTAIYSPLAVLRPNS